MRLTFIVVLTLAGGACGGNAGTNARTGDENGGSTGSGGDGAGGSNETGGVTGSGGGNEAGTTGAGGEPVEPVVDAAVNPPPTPDAGVVMPAHDAGVMPPPAGLHARVYLGGELSGDIAVADLGLPNGTLKTLTASVPTGVEPSYLLGHPGGKFLYAAHQAGNDLAAFSIDQTTGALKKIDAANTKTAPGAKPVHLAVHKSGKWIFAANIASGHVTVHPLAANGGVGTPAFSIIAGAGARHVATDVSGKYLFVTCQSAGDIAQFKFDEGTGTLTANTPPRVTVAAGSKPREIAVHPNGQWAYLLGQQSSQLITYRVDAATGTLQDPFSVSALPANSVGEAAANHLALHPSGRFAYVSLASNKAVAILAIDPQTGRPSVIGKRERDGIQFSQDFTIDPTGKYLILSIANYNGVVDFAIDQATGLLVEKGSVYPGVHHPVPVAAVNLP